MKNYVKVLIYILLDCVWIIASWLLAMLLLYQRASGNVAAFNLTHVGVLEMFVMNVWWLAGGILLAVALNVCLKLYSGLWKYAGLNEAIKIGISVFFIGIYNAIVAYKSSELTVEWAVITTCFIFMLMSASRFFVRIYWSFENSKRRNMHDNKKKVMIIGAGTAGEMLLRELNNVTNVDKVPVCLLDDDENKIGRYVHGVRVVGKIDEASLYAKKFEADEVIIAIPSADSKVMERIVSNCRTTGCKILTVSGMYNSSSDRIDVSKIREVSVLDLLGREQISVNLSEIMGYIEGKRVLVTGGGGSIGSELCRQIAEHNPSQLIIVDIYENNAYDIQQELLRKLPNLNLLVLIASVRDSKKINTIFEKYKPQLVFHAAAHKHVPLMETSPNEAVKNNVAGTYKVAQAAGENGVERFILISTDKAVNPTNIMGATKRICEMIVQTMNKKYKTEYVAVRFGNVLGSNGSVVPLFKKQIEDGGPITVTHKDIVRYFMTIPEAVSLVLQAGAYAKGGEIFVLDMGEPVRIYDLALNMIKLSGLEPFKDIDVKVTGLRPGEKLYEERLMAEEGLQKTANEMISIGKPIEIDEKKLFDKIQELQIEAYNETDRMKDLVKELVPTYVVDKRS